MCGPFPVAVERISTLTISVPKGRFSSRSRTRAEVSCLLHRQKVERSKEEHPMSPRVNEMTADLAGKQARASKHVAIGEGANARVVSF